MAKKRETEAPRLQFLEAWLDKANARATWEHRVSREVRATCYLINGQVAIVVRYGRDGWDIYTGAKTADMGATIRDAESRLGFGS